jgi:hypothetical protein
VFLNQDENMFFTDNIENIPNDGFRRDSSPRIQPWLRIRVSQRMEINSKDKRLYRLYSPYSLVN